MVNWGRNTWCSGRFWLVCSWWRFVLVSFKKRCLSLLEYHTFHLSSSFYNIAIYSLLELEPEILHYWITFLFFLFQIYFKKEYLYLYLCRTMFYAEDHPFGIDLSWLLFPWVWISFQVFPFYRLLFAFLFLELFLFWLNRMF